ncbi:MAG: hypothetical protein II951_00500 [Bacteroidales bacterium]|jgi:hypothetical protein|nr:hypothetical protein [Bacteroidales bacterium]
MVYDNSESASLMRAVLRTSYALLGIVVAFAFFADSPTLTRLRFFLLAFFILFYVVTGNAGINELRIQADKSFIEVRSTPLFKSKGHNDTYTVHANKLVDFHHWRIPPFHVLSLKYICHTGKPRRVKIGLTLMSSKARKSFIKILKEAKESN